MIQVSKIASVILLLLLIGIVVYTWQLRGILPAGDTPVPYLLYRAAIDYSGLICISIMPIGIFVAIAQMIIWRKYRTRWIFAVTSLILSCVILLFVAGNVLFMTFGLANHHDTLATDTHIYHLSSEWKAGAGGASSVTYVLWECNLEQTVCEIVSDRRAGAIFSKEDYRNAVAKLEMSAETMTVQMTIDR